MPDASLIVNGTEHFGWTEVAVTRSVEQLAHTFDVGFVERWTDERAAVPIREGDECTVKLDGEEVTEGYVVDRTLEYDAHDMNFGVAGGTHTMDLVECSAIHKGGGWKNQSLTAIARDLCRPFGIEVKAETSVGENFTRFAIEDGETVHECIERACRQRGVLMGTSPQGKLVFVRVGAKSTRTVIEFGVNVLRGASRGSWRERHSDYIIKGQAPGDDDNYGATVAQVKATSKDPEVTRYRPLIVHAETQSGSRLKDRATWERNIRAGRAVRLAYTLDGWNNAEGLWAPNTLTRVVDRRLQIDTTLLVVSVRQTKDVNGSNTTLELTDPKALSLEPLTKQAKGKSKYLDYLRGSK